MEKIKKEKKSLVKDMESYKRGLKALNDIVYRNVNKKQCNK